jgi:putative thioredoxin
MSYEVADFQSEVLDRSHQIPVLVDFWAPWCGPCRTLTPILERVAERNTGRIAFATVHTDANPELSARYGIRGIPAVKLFVEGEVADEFTGVLPEPAVEQWLDKAIPTEGKRLLARAEARLDEGDEGAAKSLLEDALATEPSLARAQVLLARLVVFEEPERARELAQGAAFAGADGAQIQQSIATIAGALGAEGEASDLPDSPGREGYAEALHSLRRGDFDAAARALTGVLLADRYYHDDAPRKLGVALFTILGPHHPATQTHRRDFDRALY